MFVFFHFWQEEKKLNLEGFFKMLIESSNNDNDDHCSFNRNGRVVMKGSF